MLAEQRLDAALVLEVREVEEVRLRTVPARHDADVRGRRAQVIGARLGPRGVVAELLRQLLGQRDVHA